ncbi:hypothetical protein DFH06DRAFT_1180124 [Mycena polygramma]|nr:hypothetical protein DFH06DRAFT_1180124 [Mycena polygramma]
MTFALLYRSRVRRFLFRPSCAPDFLRLFLSFPSAAACCCVSRPSSALPAPVYHLPICIIPLSRRSSILLTVAITSSHLSPLTLYFFCAPLLSLFPPFLPSHSARLLTFAPFLAAPLTFHLRPTCALSLPPYRRSHVPFPPFCVLFTLLAGHPSPSPLARSIPPLPSPPLWLPRCMLSSPLPSLYSTPPFLDFSSPCFLDP